MEPMKQLRQQHIRQIIERRPIRTQQELATALREHGFRATQATVSRDVAEMGLRKALRDGMPVYAAPSQPAAADAGADQRLRDLLVNLPIEIRRAGLLLVVRAVPGSAHAIAAALDRLRWPEVVGSIAGDDTVFVVLRDRAGLERVRRRLERLVEET
jgi:transcriptional regulator of arginine metabolism